MGASSSSSSSRSDAWLASSSSCVCSSLRTFSIRFFAVTPYCAYTSDEDDDSDNKNDNEQQRRCFALQSDRGNERMLTKPATRIISLVGIRERISHSKVTATNTIDDLYGSWMVQRFRRGVRGDAATT